MPSANDLLEPLDHPEQQHRAIPPEEDDPWGFNTPPSATEVLGGKKKKSKKKAKKNAAPPVPDSPPEPAAELPTLDDAVVDDSPPYPSSIAPSPSKEQQQQGVKLDAPTGPPTPALATSPLAGEPLVNFDHDDDDTDDLPPLVDVERMSSGKPSPRPPPPPVPASSFSSRSPRPAFAEPAMHTTASPPFRPASLRDRQSSITSALRPPAATKQHQFPSRRESFANQASMPRFVEPPPPHLPQAHFFTLPDFGLNLSRKQDTGKPPGADGYCCSLDSLADAGHDASARKAKDALLVGSEAGMEVYRILPTKLEVVGRLEGLRGAVIRAKIIPCTDRFDPLQPLRPLVAVVVHGLSQDSSESDRDDSDEPSVRHYQTTVEVYSLQTQAHFATLYKSAPVAAEQPAYNQVSSLPGPVGDLRLSAHGNFVIVASGQSGEVHVFTHLPNAVVEEVQYRCIGKFWTSLQTTVPASARPPSATDAGGVAVEAKELHHEPLFSLSHRWLTIVPPMLSSTMSISGAPLLSDINPNPPGLTTHIAPTQPLITCEVAGTDVEGAWIRLGRQAAQGLVKYSQKGIQMGLQGWKELTHPSPPGSSSHVRAPSKDELFPPTKGPSEDPSRLAKEPALVSVIDLDTLLRWEEYKPKHAPPPMATFALVDGCNYVSLSSTGTKLLTTSRKGEVSLVWDLSQVAHGARRRSQPTEDEPMTGPCIRQLHRIARSTPSTVLDCAWSRDDDALALLTAHGTVHLHEIPRRSSPRKRKRRGTVSAPAPEKADATTGLSMGQSPPSSNQGFLGSIKSGWQNVSTQVNSMRAANPASALGLPTTFAGFREATAAAGNAGSRAVARGLSQGYTAAKGGASDYWHADDNKIRHKALQDLVSSKSIRWVKRHSQHSLAISCGGTVHMHPIQRVERRKGDDIVTGLKSDRYARKGFALPSITTRDELDPSKGELCARQGPHGFWSLRFPSPPPYAERRKSSHLPKPERWAQDNDVETNPPYCPFHVDATVDIFAFDERAPSDSMHVSFEEFQMWGHAVENEEPWCFGSPLPASIKMNEAEAQEPSVLYQLDGTADLDEDPGHFDDDLAGQMESKLTIQPSRRKNGPAQISINTRRRPKENLGNAGSRRLAGDAEFEMMEDDDDGMM